MPTRRNRRRPLLATRAAGLAAALALAAALGGCLPPQASFDFGLGTSRIRGSLHTAKAGPLPGGPLIVVYKYHHQFVNLPDGRPVLSPTAQVLQPDPAGYFSFDMPADVLRVVVLFIAPGHLTDVFRFSRQLGVGDVTYQADLEAIPDWRDHYYTFLSPQLQELVIEPRYRLQPRDEQVLAHWLQVQNERLGARAGKP